MSKGDYTNRYLHVIVLAGFMAFVRSVPAAQGDYSALSVRQLLTQCLNESSYLYSSLPSCDLYISGFVGAIKQFDISDQYCADDSGMEISAIRREFVQWAIYHSEQYDSSAANALAGVMTSLYPCHN